MKKLSVLITIVFCIVRINAQTLNIHFKNGTKIEFHKDLVDHVDFSEKASEPTLTTGDAIDMGVSVKWASHNIGADSPEQYGDFFSWGETTPKWDSFYKESYYAYYDSNTKQYTNIGNDIKGTPYDAAHVNWGHGWRMPTYTEVKELMNKCSWDWIQINGINGYRITAQNGNSIFLPANGHKSSGWYKKNEEVHCWTSTKGSGNSAYTLCANSSYIDPIVGLATSFYYGLAIRPVISYEDSEESDYDDTSVTSCISSYYAGGSVYANGDVILNGSKLNFYFKNGSSEDVTLTGVQLVNGKTKVEGNNLLSNDVTVSAGQSIGYSITIGVGGTEDPLCKFTYRYNNHTYITEAEYQSFIFVKGETIELIDK